MDIINHSDFEIKRWDESMAEDLKTIHSVTFNTNHSLDTFKQKFAGKFYGLLPVASIAYFKDKPIGFYGVVIQKFVDGALTFFVGHTCDYITLKDYRKKGIHAALSDYSDRLMQEQGFKFKYSFDNNLSQAANTQLGWISHSKLKVLEIELLKYPLAKALGRARYILNNGRLIKRLNQKFEEQENLENPYIGLGFKGQSYLNEYEKHHTYTNTIRIKVGESQFRIKLDNVAYVACFKSNNPKTFNKDVDTLSHELKNLGIQKLIFQVQKNSFQEALLENRGEFKEGFRISIIKFNYSGNFDDFRFNFGDFDTF